MVAKNLSDIYARPDTWVLASPGSSKFIAKNRPYNSVQTIRFCSDAAGSPSHVSKDDGRSAEGSRRLRSLLPRPSRAPARKRVWNLSQEFLALLSQHVRKTGKPIRTQDSKQSWRTATPLGSNSTCQGYTLALESTIGNDNRFQLRNIRHRADSAMPRNPAKDSRPSFGWAHVRIWERD